MNGFGECKINKNIYPQHGESTIKNLFGPTLGSLQKKKQFYTVY
jgi:hypothetical protein